MTVQTQRQAGVATIVLDRPDAMNAVDKQLGTELLDALRDVGRDEAVRAVVLTGNGRAFCSGADLKAGFDPGPDGRPDVGGALRAKFHPIIHAVRELPKPVVAKVNGAAAGIGCSFALACDLIYASEKAYFLLAFVNVGLVPDGGSSFLIPERVGFARAAEMALLGERIAAPQALEWGLINRVVAHDQLDTEVDALAERLAAGPTRSYAASKRQLNAWQFERMAAQLELEATLQQEMVGTEDFVEGVSAFVSKRPARFAGR